MEQKIYETNIDKKWLGERIDKVLAALWPNISRERIKSLIQSGCITLDEVMQQNPSAIIRKTSIARVILPEAVAAIPQAQDIKLDIVYEDEDLLVINKQAGLVVHPAPGHADQTLVNGLLYHCGDSLSGIGGVKRPGILHRLDKDTSGLMLVAKHDKAHEQLSQALQNRQIKRVYQALVYGSPLPAGGSVITQIGRGSSDRKKMAVLPSGGKEAITHYQLLKNLGGAHKKNGLPLASLVECRLETGRTHQIRVHLSHLGHGLLADELYGHRPKYFPKELLVLKRHALHSIEISFVHPMLGKPLNFYTELPDDINKQINSLC